jgi:hypothetical protein
MTERRFNLPQILCHPVWILVKYLSLGGESCPSRALMPRILILAEGALFGPGVGEFWFACTFFPLRLSFIFSFIVVAVVLACCVSSWLVTLGWPQSPIINLSFASRRYTFLCTAV